MDTITIAIPKEIKRDFKAKCAYEDVTMSDKVLTWIGEFIRRDNGISRENGSSAEHTELAAVGEEEK